MKKHKFGFKVLGYFTLIFVSSFLINAVFGVGPNWILRSLGASVNVRVFIGNTFSYSGRVGAIVIITAWALRKALNANPWETLFGHREERRWKELFVGMGISTAVMVLIFVVETSMGWLKVEGWQWQEVAIDEYLRTVWLALLVNLSVAVGEEVLFRGFLLSGLERAWGKMASLAIMAVIFAAGHLIVLESRETNAFLFILLLTIPGLVFGWLFYRVRTLWLLIGIHFTWNIMQDEILNLHGRGATNLIGAITKQNGPVWIVGTDYGIEVGLAGIIGIILVGVIVMLWARNKNFGWQKKT